MPWVKFHQELRQGAKRGLKRATRFVYLELSLEARPKRGVLELPLGMGDVEGVCDILGGDPKEIREAIPKLMAGPEPMISFDGPEGARRCIITAWGKWNATEAEGASTERVRKHRETATKRSFHDGGNGDETPMKRSFHDVCNDEKRSFSIRSDQRREDQILPDTCVLPSPPESTARGAEPDTHTHTVGGPSNLTLILGALREHPALERIATPDFAKTLEGRRMVAGTPIADVLRAIGDAAADTPDGETVQSVTRRVRTYCDNARDRRLKPVPGGGRRVQHEPQRDPGWAEQEARDRAAFEAKQAELKKNPDYQEPEF